MTDITTENTFETAIVASLTESGGYEGAGGRLQPGTGVV
jgi:hypothetical protein